MASMDQSRLFRFERPSSTCPHCGSERWLARSVSPDGDVIHVGMRCDECGYVADVLRPSHGAVDHKNPHLR